jgi:hypothetical protein
MPVPSATPSTIDIKEHSYVLDVEVYDSDSHKISATENLYFVNEIAKEYFNVLSSSANHERHVVQPKKKGFSLVTATLTHMMVCAAHLYMVARGL